ncbi:MAG: hypothetical protein WC455_16285 [Dehalococcoidia bacterium]
MMEHSVGQATTGQGASFAAVHRDKDGGLIVIMNSVEAPAPPKCIRPGCLLKYVIDTLTYALVLSYHARRVAYAEKNKGKKILQRYRTGEPSPKNLWQAIHANIKLKCPVCRRYDVDPLLFAGGK